MSLTCVMTCTIIMYFCNIPVGSIEVHIATMSKVDRCKTEEVYVCGFVPAYMLPNKMPWSLDPFLHPLITEIEDAFINGKLARSFFMTNVSFFAIVFTSGPTPQVASSAVHMYVCSSKLCDVV